MNDGFTPGLIIGAIIGVFATSIVWGIGESNLKAKAVEINAAEWIVNPKSGTTTFTWKESK